MKKILVALSVAVATFVAKADTYIQLQVTFAFTASVQNSTTTTNNGFIVTAAPVKYKLDTATVLAQLAKDEYNEGNYNLPTFPTGAKLMYQLDYQDSSKDGFYVADALGNLLVDVSDIIS